MPGRLATSAIMENLTAASFDDVNLRKPGVWLVDFSTAWCPPCRVLTPVLDALAGTLAGQVGFAAVDADDEAELATRFGVVAMPTMLVFRDGRVIGQKVGAMPRAKVLAWLTSLGVLTRAA
jgi:thioredoxin 1